MVGYSSSIFYQSELMSMNRYRLHYLDFVPLPLAPISLIGARRSFNHVNLPLTNKKTNVTFIGV